MSQTLHTVAVIGGGTMGAGIVEVAASAGHAVRLEVLIGRVGDSPSRRNAIAAAQRLKAAEALVLADPFVQEMMRDFGAKIVPGSIKPL